MNSTIYRSRYFILVGLLIILCFTVMGLLMSVKFNQRTENISLDMATKVYQLKSNVMQSEFSGFVEGLQDANALLKQVDNKAGLKQAEKMISSVLLSHPQISKGWYAVGKGKDTSVTSVNRISDTFLSGLPPAHQLAWAKQQMRSGETGKLTGTLVNVADSLHWLVGAASKLADSSTVLLGLDINLKQLQHYLWSVDSTGRAYAFIIDQQGYFVTNQDENLIGTKIPGAIEPSSQAKTLGDSVTRYEVVNSRYLQLPVLRFYTPLAIAGMNWTMVVDTPLLAVVEDVDAIENYVLTMFLSMTVIILVLIAWAVSRWQKEFFLRQQVDQKRQELHMQTQALNLITERQEKESALLQLNKLKEKVNPHFLFNSLSSLNALIEQNPDLAKSFVLKLSKVYRYVLESYPNGFATVAEELRFVNEYFFLLKIRFGDALEPLELQVSEAHLEERIPFMSLQTLIENAVKHNALSKQKPLKIRIESEGEYIVVTNNLQLRSDVRDSGKQGLNYLQSTYAYFGNGQLRHGVEGDEYKCYLPVLKFTP